MAGPGARTLHPEDEISHYRIVGPLGAGGMGEVYLAQDQSLERNVALKILPPELVRSEERVRRFVLEAKSASSLSHPRQNYLSLYQVPSLGGTPRERAFDVASRVSFSPDGRQLVFWRGVHDSAQSHLVALDLGSEKERIVATVSAQEEFQGAPSWSPDGKHIATA